ncbi:MAG: polysaccharide pyruvyl transferase family protein, partial [Firmicutes bacterium]|nr:polysaccharide pyruvyl transferase family protein [Candidatus Colimorpha enterica]
FFVGARTHATIAAYSSAVPTLVVGYSVKARGIARDLFGDETGYVLPVQSLRGKNDLTRAFENIAENESAIRDRLVKIMPEWKERAGAAGDKIKELI